MRVAPCGEGGAAGAALRGDAKGVFEPDPGTLAALVFEGRKLDEALRSGDLNLEGDKQAVERFLTLFPLPEPASPAVGAYARPADRRHPESSQRS